ncbi:unnamed protein product [Closterium sp. Naga37s-1]|nr:unnamed protein product [Closterium sp. Naga37s-1]
MLRPAPPVAFHIPDLASLHKHLQHPLLPTMPPFGTKRTAPILANSATVPLSAPPLRPPGRAACARSTAGAGAAGAAASASEGAGETAAAAPSLAQQYQWKADAAPVLAAEAMVPEWLAEPRVSLLLDLQKVWRQLADIMQINKIAAARAEASGTRGAAPMLHPKASAAAPMQHRAGGSLCSATAEPAARAEAIAGRGATSAATDATPYPCPLWWCCWQCSGCWARYRLSVSTASFLVLVTKFPRFVTLWRTHIRSAAVTFSSLAMQLGARRQEQGECLASVLLQVMGVKGKEQLETGFAAHLLPLLSGGRGAHGQAGGGGECRGNGGGCAPFFPTLGHRVEEFLRRFAPARLAREGRNRPLAWATTTWIGRLGLGDRSWTSLALGEFAPGRMEPILRSRIQVDVFREMLAGRILPVPACTHCQHCIGTYYRAVKLTALVTSFAYRPSSAVLRCLLSLFPPHSARFRSFLDALGVPHVPAVVPDSLVGPLLEGVVEENRLQLLFLGTQLIAKGDFLEEILEPVGQDWVGQGEEELGRRRTGEEGEEWRMWEEVDGWRTAAAHAWPAMEARGAAAALLSGAGRRAGGVDGEELEECCAGMRHAMRGNAAIASERRH